VIRVEPLTRAETSGVPRQKLARWQAGAARHPRGTFLFGVLLGGSMLASGCGGSSPSASVAHLGTTTTLRPAKGSTSGKSNDGPLAYAQCMRAHGIPGFPDPNAQGGFSSGGSPNSDLNPDSPGFQNANADCQRFTPTSGIGHGPSPAQIAQAQAQALKFSECMRSHGVADFPDPVVQAGGGGINISIKAGQGSDLSPSSPAFQAAEQACQNVFPGSKRGSRFVTKGPAAGGSSSGGSGIAGPSTGG
jgi:hypothetical protein